MLDLGGYLLFMHGIILVFDVCACIIIICLMHHSVLCMLCALLLECQLPCSQGATERTVTPWHRGSSFPTVRQELAVHAVHPRAGPMGWTSIALYRVHIQSLAVE